MDTGHSLSFRLSVMVTTQILGSEMVLRTGPPTVAFSVAVCALLAGTVTERAYFFMLRCFAFVMKFFLAKIAKISNNACRHTFLQILSGERAGRSLPTCRLPHLSLGSSPWCFSQLPQRITAPSLKFSHAQRPAQAMGRIKGFNAGYSLGAAGYVHDYPAGHNFTHDSNFPGAARISLPWPKTSLLFHGPYLISCRCFLGWSVPGHSMRSPDGCLAARRPIPGSNDKFLYPHQSFQGRGNPNDSPLCLNPAVFL